MEEAVHWHDETVLGSKAYFYYDSIPPALKIKKVQKYDEGQYRWVSKQIQDYTITNKEYDNEPLK